MYTCVCAWRGGRWLRLGSAYEWRCFFDYVGWLSEGRGLLSGGCCNNGMEMCVYERERVWYM
jgi:hypothetical protein